MSLNGEESTLISFSISTFGNCHDVVFLTNGCHSPASSTLLVAQLIVLWTGKLSESKHTEKRWVWIEKNLFWMFAINCNVFNIATMLSFYLIVFSLYWKRKNWIATNRKVRFRTSVLMLFWWVPLLSFLFQFVFRSFSLLSYLFRIVWMMSVSLKYELAFTPRSVAILGEV